MSEDEGLLPPGTRVGAFVLEGVLGRGGMGVVYRGKDVELDRPVAIKVLAPWLAGDRELTERMQREARAMAAIDHPNLVSVYSTGEVGGTRYLAMQLVEGGTLHDLLQRESPLPVPRALEIARDVAAALACAHGAGIVHRDIKPDNVLIDPRGRVRVTDFGLARPLKASRLTAPDAFVGTPRYSAPEQWLGGDLDGRSDLYALGVVLFEMLSGRPPFDAATTPVLIRQVLEEPPPDLAALNGAVPAEVQALVERLLEKDPAHRPASAEEVVEGLEALMRGEALATPPPAAAGGRPAASTSGRPAPATPASPSRAEARPTREMPAPARSETRAERDAPGPASSRRWPWLVAAALVVLVLVGVAALRMRSGGATGPLVACVLDFENPTKSAEVDWMRVGAPDLLTTALTRYPFVRLLARDSLAVEHRKSTGGEAASEEARRLGVEALVTGRCLRTGEGQVLLDVKVQDLADGTVLAAEQVRSAAEPDALLAALDEVAGRLAQRLGARYEETRSAPAPIAKTDRAGGGLNDQLFAMTSSDTKAQGEARDVVTGEKPKPIPQDEHAELPSQGKTGRAPSRVGMGGAGVNRPLWPQGSSTGEQRLPSQGSGGGEQGLPSVRPGGRPGPSPRLPRAADRMKALALYYQALELEQDHGSEPGTREKCRALLEQALEAAPHLVPARQALDRLQ